MKHLLSLFLSTLLAFAFATTAMAQSEGADSGIDGTYTIQTANGNPVEPGHDWEITFVPVPGLAGVYVSYVTRDGEAVPGEQAVVIGAGGGVYVWENARGTTGVITTSSDGDLDSEVQTGPNAGTQRHFEKQGDNSGSDD
ncbi:MAG: hypothetical protein R3F29_01355 [Planctomycetota bacterium]